LKEELVAFCRALRLPASGRLERGLDTQIHFDKEWEGKVVKMMLHNLSNLFGRSLESLGDLNKYRKSLLAAG
jgi:hypothetical protein